MADVDGVFDKIGCWHVPAFLLMALRSWPLGLNMMFLSFAASPKQDHWCARPENFTEIISVMEWKNLAIPMTDNRYSKWVFQWLKTDSSRPCVTK